MEEWWLPITVLPGISLLALSTSNLLISLNDQIARMLENELSNQSIIKRKIKQLQLLSLALTGIYISIACFVSSGIITALATTYHLFETNWGIVVMFVGIVFVFVALILLIIYSAKAVKIRTDQFTNYCKS